jgi:hypothetical protein
MLSKFCIWAPHTFLAFASLKNRKIHIGGYSYAKCPMSWTQELNKHGVGRRFSASSPNSSGRENDISRKNVIS